MFCKKGILRYFINKLPFLDVTIITAVKIYQNKSFQRSSWKRTVDFKE